MGLRGLVSWGIAGNVHDVGNISGLLYLTLGYSCRDTFSSSVDASENAQE